MHRCHDGGIRSLTMHSRAGNLVPFASDEWFSMIRTLVEEAASLGMKLWLYDEDPFPSGAAGGLVMAERPDLRARAFRWVEKPETVKPGDLWKISRDRVVWAGLVPSSGSNPARDLTASVGPVRTDWFAVEWDSRYYYEETPLYPCPRGSALRMFYAMNVPSIPRGYRLAAILETLVGEDDGPWGSLPDLLNRESFDLYQRFGLDPYAGALGEHFGKTVPGIFTDEAKPYGGTPYTRDLFLSFRTQFGYDLKDRLYQLFGNPANDETVKTRLDYRRWVSEKFLANFIHPYRDWCDRNNLHLVGHFSPEDDPIHEVGCLASVMPVMNAMSWPGCDVIVPAVGDEKNSVLNLGSLRIASLKSQSGRRYCSSETQALGGWTITSRKTRWIYAWQKVLGVDRFFPHGFWNTQDGITNLEAPPDYGPCSSIFRGTGAVNAWLEKCDAIMDGGSETAETAILDNIFSYWTWAPDMDFREMKKWRRSLWRILLRGLQAHVGLHMLDATDAAGGAPCDSGWKVGTRTYKTLLVPACGLIRADVLRKLTEAATAGMRVVWFGGGPARMLDDSGNLAPVSALPGEVRREREPTLAWCRTNLAAVAAVGGPAARECYVRRFRAEDGTERLFAVNISEQDRIFTLADEGTDAWNPDSGLTDGETARAGSAWRWTVPGGGCGMFTRGALSQKIERVKVSRPAGENRVFKRLGENVWRLDRCRITLKGCPSQNRPYPQPYWQRFEEYRVQEQCHTFAGKVPVESTVAEKDLRYAFTVDCRAALKRVDLVLDPRCARGTFQVYWDGRKVSAPLVFPLPCSGAKRVPIRNLKRGRHTMELRFEAENAMDGLLVPVWLEGTFDVCRVRGQPVLDAAGASGVSDRGWLEMGLAHYMGDGLYRWTETFTAEEIAGGDWWLELEEVRDSAWLCVNGQDMGTLAWPAWRWKLAGLRHGRNTFTLTVSSTAGNKVDLLYPAQPQGWIGAGKLVQRGE